MCHLVMHSSVENKQPRKQDAAKPHHPHCCVIFLIGCVLLLCTHLVIYLFMHAFILMCLLYGLLYNKNKEIGAWCEKGPRVLGQRSSWGDAKAPLEGGGLSLPGGIINL